MRQAHKKLTLVVFDHIAALHMLCCYLRPELRGLRLGLCRHLGDRRLVISQRMRRRTFQEMLNAAGSTGDISLLVQKSERRLPSRVNLQEHRCQSQGEAGIFVVCAMPLEGRFARFACAAT